MSDEIAERLCPVPFEVRLQLSRNCSESVFGVSGTPFLCSGGLWTLWRPERRHPMRRTLPPTPPFSGTLGCWTLPGTLRARKAPYYIYMYNNWSGGSRIEGVVNGQPASVTSLSSSRKLWLTHITSVMPKKN